MRAPRIRALLAAALLALAAAAGQAAPAAAAPPQLEARAWALADARTGEVIAAHDGARRLPIASTTKLMTAYVAMRELGLGERVIAVTYPAGLGESLLEHPAGEPISVRDLLYGLILRSGNDAAHDLALAAAGSQPRFVRQMNGYASALGLADTHYSNPIGLDQAGNYSSALDLVTLARRLLAEPAFARIADSREAVLTSLSPPRRIETRNDFLLLAPWATGVKTGYTLDADYVLVGSGRRDGVELVSAVLGAPSEAARDAETLELLEYGFSRYRERVPVRRGSVPARPEVRYAEEDLALRAARGVAVGVREDQRLGIAVRAPEEVEGPIRRGAVLGLLLVSVDGRRVAAVPLRAARAVPEASELDKVRSYAEANLAWLALALFAILGGGAILIRRLKR